MLTFLTGFIASIAHVATGPDHLAAVTPLAIDSRKKSWLVGFSWGLGHTIGMLLIGLLFVLFRDFLPVEAISRHSDTVIGFLLIGIGIWALVRMYRQHSHGYLPHAHFHTTPFLYAHIHKHTHLDKHSAGHDPDHAHTHEHYHPSHNHPQDGTHFHPDGRIFYKGAIIHNRRPLDSNHGHTHSGKVKQNAFSAFLIGVIHGFAGFSHLFALLPSLAFPTLIASVIYVVAFASGTILTMVFFALILGFIAHKSVVKDKQVFLKWFSLSGAILAIAIGLLWIIHPIG